MKLLRNIIVICFAVVNNVYGQCDSVLNQLPSSLQTGVVIYPSNDSVYFVFRATDYIAFAGLEEGYTTNDSVKLAAIQKLIQAKYVRCTLLGELQYDSANLFPNTIVLKEMFEKRLIRVMSFQKGMYHEISYKSQKKRGKNIKWEFRVVARQSKNILFEIGYGPIYN